MIGQTRHAERWRYAEALAFAGVAGAVDAVGFVHFRTFFVSFMSGNTTRVAVAMVEGRSGLAWQGAAIIGCFVAGVMTGDVLTGVRPRRRRATLLVESALMLLAAGSGRSLAVPLLLTLAMGMHNSLMLHAERISVTLTYVTGTLVNLGRAAAARLRHRDPPGELWPYGGLWLALFAGAVLGGAGALWSDRAALLALACALTALAIATPDRDVEA